MMSSGLATHVVTLLHRHEQVTDAVMLWRCDRTAWCRSSCWWEGVTGDKHPELLAARKGTLSEDSFPSVCHGLLHRRDLANASPHVANNHCITSSWRCLSTASHHCWRLACLLSPLHQRRHIEDITLRMLHSGFSAGWVQGHQLGGHSTEQSGTYVHIYNRMRCSHAILCTRGQKVQFFQWTNLGVPVTTHVHTTHTSIAHNTRHLTTRLARKQDRNTHIALNSVTWHSMLENLVLRERKEAYTSVKDE